MPNTELQAEIIRLENLFISTERSEPDSDRALLRLAALHLQHPAIDPPGASWTGRQIQGALDAFYSGHEEAAFKLDRSDPRKAYSRNGRDRRTGLTWPTAILFEYDTLPKHGRLIGEDIFYRIAKRPSIPFSRSRVKVMYYEARSSPSHMQELENFYRKHHFPKNRRLSGKTQQL